MADYFSGIVDFVGVHPNYAFVAVFCLGGEQGRNEKTPAEGLTSQGNLAC
jgi:hypothetical protein